MIERYDATNDTFRQRARNRYNERMRPCRWAEIRRERRWEAFVKGACFVSGLILCASVCVVVAWGAWHLAAY